MQYPNSYSKKWTKKGSKILENFSPEVSLDCEI